MNISTLSPTTAQSLGALLKSARDTIRKDKRPNGDLDQLPMLTSLESELTGSADCVHIEAIP